MSQQRWQYQVVDVKSRTSIFGRPMDDLQDTLNRLGTQGWELVCSHQIYGYIRLTLKRPG